MAKNRKVNEEMSENKKKALETIASAFEKMSEYQKSYFVGCVERLGELKNRKVDLDKEAEEAWKTFNRTGDRSKIAEVCAVCIDKMTSIRLLQFFLGFAVTCAKKDG